MVIISQSIVLSSAQIVSFQIASQSNYICPTDYGRRLASNTFNSYKSFEYWRLYLLNLEINWQRRRRHPTALTIEKSDQLHRNEYGLQQPSEEHFFLHFGIWYFSPESSNTPKNLHAIIFRTVTPYVEPCSWLLKAFLPRFWNGGSIANDTKNKYWTV